MGRLSLACLQIVFPVHRNATIRIILIFPALGVVLNAIVFALIAVTLFMLLLMQRKWNLILG